MGISLSPFFPQYFHSFDSAKGRGSLYTRKILGGYLLFNVVCLDGGWVGEEEIDSD